MTDRFATLRESITDELDKLSLADAYNARIKAMQARRERPGKQTIDDLKACEDHFEQTIDTLWSKYFPEKAKSPADHWFRDKASAFCWYTEQGGQRQKSSFYAVVPADGRRVSRFAVSEMLRKEKSGPAAPVAADLSAQREEAETRKAIADADKSQMQAEEMRRALDKKWMLRETAEEEICVWVARLRDAVAYHLGKIQLAIIHACGGQPARLAEVQALIDDALAAAGNEIANSEEVTVLIEDCEDNDS